MKKVFLSLMMILSAVGAMAQKYVPWTELRPQKTVFLYADDAKEAVAAIDDPVVAKDVECLGLDIKEECGITNPECMQGDLGQIREINGTSRFDLYFPENPNGQMVVICPGGGYVVVCTYGEGLYAAEWLLQRGITVAVAKHRMPNGHWTVPLDDIQEIFRYCRKHAGEWNVRKIGVMGFSAGGHLAASASTLYVDEITRPDFSILYYPVITFDKEQYVEQGSRENLIGSKDYWAVRRGLTSDEYIARQKVYEVLKEYYSLEKRVDKNTPPAYIVHGQADDVVPVENSLMYYSRLIECGVKSELQIYDSPKHGFCFFDESLRDHDWLSPEIRSALNASLERWLKQME